jgi:hypothetical protein
MDTLGKEIARVILEMNLPNCLPFGTVCPRADAMRNETTPVKKLIY